MIHKIKDSSLVKNTFIYTLLQLINKGIPFFLLPILTRYLSTDDYGLIASYNTFLGFIAIFVGLSIAGAVNVNYFHLSKEKLKVYIGNTFLLLFISAFIVSIFIFPLKDFIYQYLSLSVEWLYIAVLVAFMQNITGINLILWQSEQRAKPFAIYEIMETITNVSISLFLVIVLNYGWEGRVSATAIAAILFGLFSFIFIFKRGYSTLKYSLHNIKDALNFGIPLIPHRLALWMRAGIDIIFITSIIGVSATGVYSVGYQLGAVIGIVSMAFNNAYSPYLFKKLKMINQKEKNNIVKFTYLYFLGVIILALIISYVFSLLLPYVVAESFQEANQYIVWVALAYSFNGMYLMVVNYIFYVKKTYLLSMVTISTSILHVVLSYTLIQINGAIGAAYASLISFLVTFLLVWRISAKVYPMPWFGE